MFFLNINPRINLDFFQGKEPVGFGYTGHFSLENVWEDEEHFLLKITFAKSNDGGNFVTRKGKVINGGNFLVMNFLALTN